MSSHPRGCGGLDGTNRTRAGALQCFILGEKMASFFFFFVSNRQIALGKSSNSKRAHPSPTSLK